MLEWVAMPSSSVSSPPRDQTLISYVFCIGRGVFFTTSNPWETNQYTYVFSVLGLPWWLRR